MTAPIKPDYAAGLGLLTHAERIVALAEDGSLLDAVLNEVAVLRRERKLLADAIDEHELDKRKTAIGTGVDRVLWLKTRDARGGK